MELPSGEVRPRTGHVGYLVRVEHNEQRFVRELCNEIDGVVVLTRFLSTAARSGVDVAAAAREARVPLIYDPDTWPLAEISDQAPGEAESLAGMRSARGLQLPLTPEALSDVGGLVSATLAVQIGAGRLAAPYFEFRSLYDPWLEVNLRCIGAAVRRSRGRPLAAFVRGGPDTAADGTLARAASRYAEVLPAGSLVFLSVAGLQPREAEVDVLDGYLAAVQAFTAFRLSVVADRVDRFASIAVAAGAVGGAWGTRIYRTTPPTAIWTSDFNPIVPMPYQAPGRGDQAPFDKARDKSIRGTFPLCPIEECDVLSGHRSKRTPFRLRGHANHLHRYELGAAAASAQDDLVQTLKSSSLAAQRRYGEALDSALRRTQAL